MSNLEIRRVHLPQAAEAQGVVIVVDVICVHSSSVVANLRNASTDGTK
jgi:hypothetical protein